MNMQACKINLNPPWKTGSWKMLPCGSNPSSAAMPSTACLTGQNGMLDTHHLEQRQGWCWASIPIILFITPVLRCVPVMWGKAHFPTLSHWWISGKLVLQISVISNNYHIRLATTPKNAATNSSLRYDHKLGIQKSPVLCCSGSHKILQISVIWEGLIECCIFQVIARYLRSTLIPVSSSLKHLKVHFKSNKYIS